VRRKTSRPRARSRLGRPKVDKDSRKEIEKFLEKHRELHSRYCELLNVESDLGPVTYAELTCADEFRIHPSTVRRVVKRMRALVESDEEIREHIRQTCAQILPVAVQANNELNAEVTAGRISPEIARALRTASLSAVLNHLRRSPRK
jgi:hypothetical protein